MRWYQKRQLVTPKEQFVLENPPKNGIGLIPLSKGMFATVDEDDYYNLVKHTWCYSEKNGAIRWNKKRMVIMHRVIMNAPSDMQVDHWDMDTCNNRKGNLRICTSSQNMANRRKREEECRSLYKGVYWHNQTKTWTARVTKNRKIHYLGYHPTEEEAAIAYNKKASELFGEFARLNVL